RTTDGGRWREPRLSGGSWQRWAVSVLPLVKAKGIEGGGHGDKELRHGQSRAADGDEGAGIRQGAGERRTAHDYDRPDDRIRRGGGGKRSRRHHARTDGRPSQSGGHGAWRSHGNAAR